MVKRKKIIGYNEKRIVQLLRMHELDNAKYHDYKELASRVSSLPKYLHILEQHVGKLKKVI